MQVVITLAESPHSDDQEITRCTTEILRQLAPEGKNVLVAISEDDSAMDEAGHHRLERKIRKEVNPQPYSKRCREYKALVPGEDYEYTHIHRGVTYQILFRKLEWTLESPYRNFLYHPIHDSLLRNIHSLHSWNLLVHNLFYRHQYIFYTIHAFILVFTAQNVESAIARQKNFDLLLSLPKANVIVVVTGKPETLHGIFNLFDRFSIFGAAVITQDNQTDDLMILGWIWDDCGFFKHVKTLGSCTEILKSKHEIKAPRPLDSSDELQAPHRLDSSDEFETPRRPETDKFEIPHSPKKFKGCRFITYGRPDPPFAIINQFGLVMDGIGVRLLQAIASHMNFTIKHSYSPDLHNNKEHVTYALYTGHMIDPYSYISMI